MTLYPAISSASGEILALSRTLPQWDDHGLPRVSRVSKADPVCLPGKADGVDNLVEQPAAEDAARR
jgi:hypothetical protein